ncbi:succinate dehydrogenase assembly factor 2 [Kangiella sp. HZ709]|uniref:FAD assembly factor SdhE n=1 Tax=Kangiella sp. HZ709 TaxID=2666328 RepID=UPI0012AF1FE3|nr:succinate dehydrogenase assembly factor 2 [Kangiella sp. HZ709]MRX27356.1 succinate dehydrogenase assembly factor 2 family protein [Kangiella sp. HZ709]
MDRKEELKALLWASRRGMLELDVILAPYLEVSFSKMEDAEVDHFKHFLTNDDPDLYAWLMGYESPTAEFSSLVHKIQAYLKEKLTKG